MSLTLSIIAFWIFLLASIWLYKDYLHPAIIFCVPWCILLIFLPRSGFSYNASSTAYLYFALGGLVFLIGTAIGTRTVVKDKRIFGEIDTYYPNYGFLRILLVLEVIFTVYTLISFYRFIRAHYSINIFLSYYINRSEFGADGLINYGRNIVLAAVLSMITGYSHVSEEEKPRYKIYLTIEMIFYLALSLTKMTRNGILNSVLPVLAAIIIVSKAKNKTVFKWGIIGGVGLIVLFSVVSILKSPYLFENRDVFDVLTQQFSLYSTGGFVAFQQQFDYNSFPHLGGANTFRTFLAIGDRLFGTNNAPPLIQQSISIGQGTMTNVYTFYHWYVSDFGLVYALFIQLLIGIIHGKIYREMTEYKLFGIYKYCIFLYPMIMQIFQDQYFSLLSNWIQQLVFGLILLNSSILFSRNIDHRNGLVWYRK